MDFFSPWHEIIGAPGPTPLQLWENSDYYFYGSQLSASLLGHGQRDDSPRHKEGAAFRSLIRSVTTNPAGASRISRSARLERHQTFSIHLIGGLTA